MGRDDPDTGAPSPGSSVANDCVPAARSTRRAPRKGRGTPNTPPPHPSPTDEGAAPPAARPRPAARPPPGARGSSPRGPPPSGGGRLPAGGSPPAARPRRSPPAPPDRGEQRAPHLPPPPLPPLPLLAARPGRFRAGCAGRRSRRAAAATRGPRSAGRYRPRRGVRRGRGADGRAAKPPPRRPRRAAPRRPQRAAPVGGRRCAGPAPAVGGAAAPGAALPPSLPSRGHFPLRGGPGALVCLPRRHRRPRPGLAVVPPAPGLQPRSLPRASPRLASPYLRQRRRRRRGVRFPAACRGFHRVCRASPFPSALRRAG